MAGQWFFHADSEVYGPFSKTQLTTFIREGRITPATQLRNGVSGPWRKAADVPGLFEQAFQRPGQKHKDASSTAPLPKPLILGLIIGGTALAAIALTAAVGIGLYFLFRDGDDDVAQRNATVQPQQVVKAAREDRPLETPTPKVIDFEPAVAAFQQQAAAVVEPLENMPSPAIADIEPQPADVDPAPEAAELPAAPPLDPKPLIPPIPAEKVAITDAEIRQFSRSLALQRKAVDAYSLYDAFSQSYVFTEAQHASVDAELAEWKSRADADLYRLGDDWVPLAEVQAAEVEADQLIERASALIEVYSIDECIQFLEDASRVNPNGIKADYILGLLYSLPFAGPKAPDTAESHFRKVLQRQPDHPAALNSIAIAQIKQAEFGVAITNLSRAASLMPQCQEVAQNVGRLILLAQSGRAPVSESVLRRYTDLYAELIADKKADAFDEGTGWLHMQPVFTSNERNSVTDREKDVQQAAAAGLVIHGYGSGFAVGPELVLTNRHVVCSDENGLGVVDLVRLVHPTTQQSLDGQVIAVSDDSDLALVKFAGLNAHPLPLSAEPAHLASEVMILGYPRSDVFGNALKATRGVVSALPDESRLLFPQYYLFDATSDHGSSGGPIVTQDGRVVALLTAGVGLRLRIAAELEAEFSAGVTATDATRFVQANAPDWKPDVELEDRAAVEWATVVDRSSKSVYRLTAMYKGGVPVLTAAATRESGYENPWEDRTCPHCNGWGRLPCPKDGCLKGQISIKYFVEQVVGQAVIRQPRFRKETCPTCNGAATVDCPGCTNGFDKSLR